MSISVLHPAGFIETGDCSGPRLVRNQPSRESGGTLLNEVTNKYVTEFTVPFRNAVRSLKEFKLNWDRINDEQKQSIMKMVGPFVEQDKQDKQNSLPKMRSVEDSQVNNTDKKWPSIVYIFIGFIISAIFFGIWSFVK